MSATNSTPNYDLPLFVASDKPSWQGDWNGAMTKIDTAIKQASETGSGGEGDESEALLVANQAKALAEQANTSANQASSTASAASQTAQSAATLAQSTQDGLTQTNKTVGQNTTDVASLKEQLPVLQANVTTATQTANQAQTDATSAKSTAQNASSQASTANTNASAALTQAQDAQSTGSNAQRTANTALTTANQALQYRFYPMTSSTTTSGMIQKPTLMAWDDGQYTYLLLMGAFYSSSSGALEMGFYYTSGKSFSIPVGTYNIYAQTTNGWVTVSLDVTKSSNNMTDFHFYCNSIGANTYIIGPIAFSNRGG